MYRHLHAYSHLGKVIVVSRMFLGGGIKRKNFHLGKSTAKACENPHLGLNYEAMRQHYVTVSPLDKDDNTDCQGASNFETSVLQTKMVLHDF